MEELAGMAELQALAGTEVMAPLAMQRLPMEGMAGMVVMQGARVQQAQAERPEGLAPLLVLPVQWVPRFLELPVMAAMAVLVLAPRHQVLLVGMAEPVVTAALMAMAATAVLAAMGPLVRLVLTVSPQVKTALLAAVVVLVETVVLWQVMVELEGMLVLVARAVMAAAVSLGLMPCSVLRLLLRLVVPAAMAATEVPVALAGLVAWQVGQVLLLELRAMVVTVELRAMVVPALTVATVPVPSFLR